MMVIQLFLFLLCFHIPFLAQAKDTIKFVNGGQGSMVFIDREGTIDGTDKTYVSLLVDPGASVYPPRWNGRTRKWVEDRNGRQLVQDMHSEVLEVLKHKNKKKLNIIITHPDDDHYRFAAPLIKALIADMTGDRQVFTCNLVCGGSLREYRENDYGRELLSLLYKVPNKNGPKIRARFAQDPEIQGLFTQAELVKNLKFLKASGCVSTLFVPRLNSNTNEESIITQVKINGLKFLLTGDAEESAKREMCLKLEQAHCLNSLKSDGMQSPHHGGHSNRHYKFEPKIDPKVLVISAGMNKGYKHPQGLVILEFLTNFENLIWDYRTKPHIIQYYARGYDEKKIQECAKKHKFLYERIDNGIDGLVIAWTDLPVYTLWSSGSVSFADDLNNPTLEYPLGVADYIPYASNHSSCDVNQVDKQDEEWHVVQDENSAMVDQLPLSTKALQHYMETYHYLVSNGFSYQEITFLCPSGFVDWLDLCQLINLVFKEFRLKNKNIDLTKDAILMLRKQGRSFQEIGRVLIEDRYKKCQQLNSIIESYFPNDRYDWLEMLK